MSVYLNNLHSRPVQHNYKCVSKLRAVVAVAVHPTCLRLLEQDGNLFGQSYLDKRIAGIMPPAMLADLE